jgi:hypothetical protein
MNSNIPIPQVIAPFRMWLNESLQANQIQNSKSMYESRPLDILDTFFVVRNPVWLYYIGIIGVVFFVMKRLQSPTWDTSFLIVSVLILYIFFIQQKRTDEGYSFDIMHRLNFMGTIMYGSGDRSTPIFTMQDYILRNFYDENTLNYYPNYPAFITFFDECKEYSTIHMSAYRNAMLEVNVFCKYDFLLRNQTDQYPDKGEVIQNMYQHMNNALDHFASIYYKLEPLSSIIELHDKRVNELQKLLWIQFQLTYQWVMKQENTMEPTIFTMWDDLSFIQARTSIPKSANALDVDRNHFGTFSKL